MNASKTAADLGKVVAFGDRSVSPAELGSLRAVLSVPATRKFAAARLVADQLGVGPVGLDLLPLNDSVEFDSWFKKVLRGAAKVAGALGYGPMQEEGSRAFRKLVGAEVEPTASEQTLLEGEEVEDEDFEADSGGDYVECDGENCLKPCCEDDVARSTEVLVDHDRRVVSVAGKLPTLLYDEFGMAGPLQLGKFLSGVLRDQSGSPWGHNFEVRDSADAFADFDALTNKRASFLAVPAPAGVVRMPHWASEPVGSVISAETGDGIAQAGFTSYRGTRVPRGHAALVHLTSLKGPATEFDRDLVRGASIEFFKLKKLMKKLKKVGKGLLKFAAPVLSTIIPGGGLVTGLLGNVLGGGSKSSRPAAVVRQAVETPSFSPTALASGGSGMPSMAELATMLRSRSEGALPFDPSREMMGATQEFVSRRMSSFLPSIDDELLASYRPSSSPNFPHEIASRPELRRLIPRRRRPMRAPLARYVPSMLGSPLPNDMPQELPPQPPEDWAPHNGAPSLITESRIAVPWWGGARYVGVDGGEGE